MLKAQRIINISMKILKILEDEKVSPKEIEKICFGGMVFELYTTEHPKREG